MANQCLECGGKGGKKDFVFCSDCHGFALHRYCFPEWPETKLGNIHWVCGCSFQPDSVTEQIDTGFMEEDEDDHNDDDANDAAVDDLFNHSTNGSPDNEKPLKKTNQLATQRIPPMKSFTGYGNLHGPDKPVEPLIRSVWTGSFLVNFMYEELVQRSIEGFSGFLSNKASRRAKEEVGRFGPVMRLEMVPKDLVWPKWFGEEGPSGEDIHIYFFPCLRHDGHLVYDYLVYEMGRDDVAMRMVIGDSELLVFTSVELPAKLRRFQGTLYLWGLVKEKTVVENGGGFYGLSH